MLKSHSGESKKERYFNHLSKIITLSRRLLFASVILTNLERLSFVSQRNIKCLNIFWYIANLFICYNYQNLPWLKKCKSKKFLNLLIFMFHLHEYLVSYSPVIPYKRKEFPSFDIPFFPLFCFCFHLHGRSGVRPVVRPAYVCHPLNKEVPYKADKPLCQIQYIEAQRAQNQHPPIKQDCRQHRQHKAFKVLSLMYLLVPDQYRRALLFPFFSQDNPEEHNRRIARKQESFRQEAVIKNKIHCPFAL